MQDVGADNGRSPFERVLPEVRNESVPLGSGEGGGHGGIIAPRVCRLYRAKGNQRPKKVGKSGALPPPLGGDTCRAHLRREIETFERESTTVRRAGGRRKLSNQRAASSSKAARLKTSTTLRNGER